MAPKVSKDTALLHSLVILVRPLYLQPLLRTLQTGWSRTQIGLRPHFAAAFSTARAMASKSECVTVAVRCRPLNGREVAEGRQAVASLDKALKQVTLGPAKPGEVAKSFTFDHVFDTDASQAEVYDGVAKGLVESVMQGYNGALLVAERVVVLAAEAGGATCAIEWGK